MFSQFSRTWRWSARRSIARGYRYQYLDGSTPTRQRAKRVERFQAGEGDVFLICLKAGGIGINLTARRLRDPPRSVVEPGRRGPGHRPRPPHRPAAAGHGLPADRARHDRGTDPRAAPDKRDLAAGLLDGTDRRRLGAEDLLDLIRV